MNEMSRKTAENLAVFQDGALIFREGERGDAAYRIVSGQVGLLKNTEAGPIQIEKLSGGALFGETGILDNSRRTMSARAIGEVTVEVMQREAFLESIRRDPEQALSMMSKIAERAGSTAALATARQQSTPLGDTVLAGWLSRFLKPKPKPVPLVEVRVPGFAGENGDTAARKIMAGLEGFTEFKVRAVALPKSFPANGVDETTVAAWAAEARKLLRNSGGDILLWGKTAPAGGATRLHMVSALPGDEDLPGNLTGFAEVPVLAEPEEQDFQLLHGAILAAAAPQAGIKTNVVQTGLTGAVNPVRALVSKPHRSFTQTDRIHLLLTGGHILATAVQRAAQPLEAFRDALGFYQQALEMLPVDAPPLVRGLTLKSIGGCLMILSEREQNPDRDDLMLETMSAACEMIPRDTAPREWASAHNRLGQMLYRLDLTEADAEMTHLKRALAAFRSAMEVYTRVDAPERWADVMNNYAQAAQVLGGNMQSPKILQNSVQACRNALEVRRREKNPLLWASTQNTLGSGLFLLGKVTRRTDHLEAAADAFRAAHAVYANSGSQRMAAIIERNHRHVNHLIAIYSERAISEALQTDPETGEVIDDAWWKANVVDIEETRQRATG